MLQQLVNRLPKSRSTNVEVNQAVTAARNAGPAWAALSKEERADWLDRIADALEECHDEIAELESMDTGKPIRIARSVDANRSVANFRFYADLIRNLDDQTRCRMQRIVF